MSHKKSSKKESGSEEFASYFAKIYKGRWPALLEAMAQPTRHVSLWNSLSSAPCPSDGPLPGSTPHSTHGPIRTFKYDLASNPSGVYPQPGKDAGGMSHYYWLDPASVIPPLLLGARPGDAVLDMCAAPGGKSLLLAMSMWGNGGEGGERAAGMTPGPLGRLETNEPDVQRRARLVQVLKDYLPESFLALVKVTNYDGTRYYNRYEEDTFDAVLVDVPCSSDRHVLQHAVERRRGITRLEWSANKCKEIAALQLRLLLAALRTCKVGGRVVYSTCSIADVENDGVVGEALKRCGKAVRCLPAGPVPLRTAGSSAPSAGQPDDDVSARASTANEGSGAAAGPAGLDPGAMGAERTRHGWLFFPDTSACGPIYVAVLEKTAALEPNFKTAIAVLRGQEQAELEEEEAEEEAQEDLDGGELEGESGEGRDQDGTVAGTGGNGEAENLEA